ncbi:hypothetical protein [Telmatospirillum sp.]|uniref:hypothetical protein n=1 Tax=Telmatospirillum sp. TaxID=2079197 RepID=UPI00284E9E6B|nr:hypothetical protein [Telmatospirillum sp.]MDR3438472.1 hypothetical protein [Telmatospirillum sp.]
MATQSNTAASKPVDPDVLARREVTRMLKGPVAEKFKSLIPPLASNPDPYKTIMDTPELLDACFKLFRMKEEAFAEFLVDSEGNPVRDDSVRLRCGRSVDEIIGMAVRTGMRTYAELHFGDPIVPPKTKAAAPSTPAPKKQQPSRLLKLVNVEKLAGLFKRNYGQPKPLPAGQTQSGRFYTSIKDNLDYEWQVRFFPIYVEIPPHVFDRLGIGITRMDTEERLQLLAQMAITDITKAETVIKDPALFREMMENNVLASATVSHLGEEAFGNVHDALEHLDPQKKWNVLANKDTAIRLHEDKRITKNDIAALADYLDILNEYALDAIFDLKLNRDQMQMFLKTAEDNLGQDLFMAMFGPVQMVMPDDHDEQQKLRRYQTFTQTALRNLVSAVKQLDDSLRKSGSDDTIEECLGTVCRARRPDLEKEIKKLAPTSLGA